jgi:hypothetical protein
LELGALRTDNRPEGYKAKVLVQLLLAEHSGDSSKVIPLIHTVLRQPCDQLPQDPAAAMVFLYGKEAQFTYGTAARQIGIQIFKFFVERKRTFPSDGYHAY